MKEKIYKILSIVMIIAGIILLLQRNRAQAKLQQSQQELRKEKIYSNKLLKVSDGYYQKFIADTLTKAELRRITKELIDIKNRKPISVTNTIIQPKEVIKETDYIDVVEDSIFIEDYYPNKSIGFLKYTNRLSIKSKKGFSKFKFDTISINQVVTKRSDGIYQVDFIGPEFLDLKSISIQAEPMESQEPDNTGLLLGVEYGKNINNDRSFIGADAYFRFKKFYIGIGANTNTDVKAGIKIEL